MTTGPAAWARPAGLAAAAVFMLALPPAASAEDPPDCDKPEFMTDELFCAGVDAKFADILLEDFLPNVYEYARRRDAELAELFESLGSQTTVELLEEGQRNWAAHRASVCRYEGYVYFGGSYQPLYERRCLARMARERLAFLNERLPEDLRKAEE